MVRALPGELTGTQQLFLTYYLELEANLITSKFSWLDLDGLTTDNSYAEVKLQHAGAEGG